MGTESQDRRVRGWLLLQSGDAGEAVEKIRAYFTQGKDDYVVIRADIVSHEKYNVIVPLDAKNAGEFKRVVREIVDLKVGGIEEAMVTQSNPDPPHDAHGFVTQDEFNKGKDKKIEPGLQKSDSPGANPWG